LDRIKAPRAAGILRHCFILPLVKVKLTDHASGFACPANLQKRSRYRSRPRPERIYVHSPLPVACPQTSPLHPEIQAFSSKRKNIV